MAVLTSHVLSGLDGSHATDVTMSLLRDSSRYDEQEIFIINTDKDGRVRQEFEAIQNEKYELIVDSSSYFERFHGLRSEQQIIPEIVIRFIARDPNGKYHIPIILSPNSYSCWWSSLQSEQFDEND